MRRNTLFFTQIVLQVFVLLVLVLLRASGRNECKKQTFPGSDRSFVCVCSSAYCDTVDNYEPLPSGQVAVYSSTMDGDRLTQRLYDISHRSNASSTSITYVVNKTMQYQKMLGFGGAFTDAAVINILNLSKPAQELLLKSYYHPDGIEYTFGRVPIASCDFSTHVYSYDDHPNDFQMKKFSLTKEDLEMKIPIIHRALNMSKRNVKLFASAWSAPGWMKTNLNMSGGGKLNGEAGGKYYQAFALYLVRFLEEYKKQNLTMWGMTVLNEPMAALAPNYFQSMYLNAENERDFIKMDLGPTLEQQGHGDLKLMMLDDQRLFLSLWAQTVLGDKDAARYVSGIGVHWYRDTISPISKLTETHQQFPDHFILYTEACNGFSFWNVAVLLGNWDRGAAFSEDILWDVNNWVTGWNNWNLALNMDGGPNWASNFVDSPIIVDAEADLFYKQPMYYHLGHFSKFIEPDSVRIDAKENQSTVLFSAAFQLPNGKKVFVVLNRTKASVNINIKDPDSGYINAQVPAFSIQTYIWK